MQQALARRLEKNDIYKVIDSDKNCGQALIEVEYCTERSVSDHLSDTTVYRRIPKHTAKTFVSCVENYLIEGFISKYRANKVLSEAEATYLNRGLDKCRGGIARFYTTVKVHKSPIKFRPIVSTCGTAVSVLSSWLDYQLQKLKQHISTYLKDSDDLIEQLKELEPLQYNAKLITADARQMYTEINTDHALEVLKMFLEELDDEGKLPSSFDINAVLEAAKIVMRWNIFECGDCYFRQMTGTAMGTPAACMWAVIYYYWHEKHLLLPRHHKTVPFLRRYIDDMIAVVLVGGEDGATADDFESFKSDLNNFGPKPLIWDANDPAQSVDFDASRSPVGHLAT